jgi:hypothetical protein
MRAPQRRAWAWFLWLAMAVASCSRPPELEFVEFGASLGPAELTSMVAVLANPQQFHGKRLRLQGALNIQLEGDQLCLDRGSLQGLATMNCLRLGLADALSRDQREIARWNGDYAVVEGVLSAASDPTLLYRGRLRDVTHILVIKSGRLSG